MSAEQTLSPDRHEPVTVLTVPESPDLAPGLVGICHRGTTLAVPEAVLGWDDFAREQYIADREAHAAEGRRILGLHAHLERLSAAERERGAVSDDSWDLTVSSLGMALSLSKDVAFELVSVAVELVERLPRTATMLRCGWLGLDAARTIAAETFLVADEHVQAVDRELRSRLAPTRRRLHPPRQGPLKRMLRRVIDRIDPVAARARAERAREDIEVRVRHREDDVSDLDARLPTDWAVEIDQRLDEIVARSESQNDRSRGQLRAQALLAAVRGWSTLTGPEDAARRVVLHVYREPDPGDFEIYHLPGVGPVSTLTGDDLERTMLERHHEIAGFADPTTPAAVRYRPSDALRHFVRGRDGTCVFPGCSVPATSCELDHIEPFDRSSPESGGRTTSDNLACLCHSHHERKTMGGFVYYRDADGGYVWTAGPAHPAPEGVTEQRSEPTGPLAEHATPLHAASMLRQRAFARRAGLRGARLHRPRRVVQRAARRRYARDRAGGGRS